MTALPKVLFGVPFWHGGNQSRIDAYDKVLEQLMELSGGGPVATYRGLPLPFNRARARNTAVRALRAQQADVIVLCDADSVPTMTGLKAAIQGALLGGVHFPFDTVHNLDRHGNVRDTYGPSAGGCWVFRPEVWADLGGMDTRGGWSVDDRAFLVAINTLSYRVHHPGVLKCYWHERGPETVLTPESTRIIGEYLALEGQPEALREYIRCRDKA